MELHRLISGWVIIGYTCIWSYMELDFTYHMWKYLTRHPYEVFIYTLIHNINWILDTLQDIQQLQINITDKYYFSIIICKI